MVKRRLYRKKPTTRRFVKKRKYPRRVPRPIGKTATMYIKRKLWSATWLPATAATSDFWKQFTLNLTQIPNYTEFTNMFDQYRIAAIKWTFYPRFTDFSGNDNTDTTPPGVTNIGQNIMHICYDIYSTVSPSGTYTSTNLNSFMEQGRIKTVTNGNRPIQVYVKPVIQGNYIGGTATNMFTKSKWLPTSSPSIPHYGPNIFVQDLNLAGVFGQQYDILVTAYIAVRNQK